MNKYYLTLIGFVTPLLSANAQTIGDTGKSEREQVTVIEPVKEKSEIKSAEIDDEKFELGAFMGSISLEDFNTVSMIGVNANYHLNESWLIGASYGKSGPPEAAFEDTLDEDFVTNREDGFQYIAVTGAYELFEGRSFLGKSNKFSTHLYFEFGIESIDFDNQSEAGITLGTSYKFVANDWLTCDIRMRDHIMNRTFLGEEKLTQNIEFAIGISALF